MNILLVSDTYLPYITGVAISTDNIARFMLSRGHNVTIIYPKQLANSYAEYPKGLKRIVVPALPFSFYNHNVTANIFVALKLIENKINTTKFDIVHIQEPGLVGLCALYKAKKHGIPVVGALHFIPEQIDRVLWGYFEKVFTPIINVFVHMFITNMTR